MHRLIYVSSAHPSVDDAMLEQIGTQSTANNLRDGLTGMLLWVNDAFLQVLEGSEAALTATAERIKQDRRHRQVTRLSYAPISERLFPDWAMGYHAMDAHQFSEALVPKPDSKSIFEQLTAAPDLELSVFLKNFYTINVPRAEATLR